MKLGKQMSVQSTSCMQRETASRYFSLNLVQILVNKLLLDQRSRDFLFYWIQIVSVTFNYHQSLSLWLFDRQSLNTAQVAHVRLPALLSCDVGHQSSVKGTFV